MFYSVFVIKNFSKNDYLEGQVNAFQHQLLELTQLQANESLGDSRLSLTSEPPSFSKLNNTDTPNLLMELEVDRLKVELGEAKESTKSISDQLAKSEAMVSESKDQIAALQAELHAEQSRSGENQATIDQLNRVNVQLEEAIGLKDKQFEALQATSAELEESAKKQSSEAEVLTSSIKSLREACNSKAAKIDDLTRKLADEKHRRSIVEIQVKEVSEKLETAQLAQNTAEKRRGKAETDHNEALDYIQAERSKRLEAENARDRVESELHQAELAAKDTLRKAKEDFEAEKSQVLVKLETSERANAALQQQNSELSASKQLKDQQLAETEAIKQRLEQLESEVICLKSENEQIRDEKVKVVREFESEKQGHAQLTINFDHQLQVKTDEALSKEKEYGEAIRKKDIELEKLREANLREDEKVASLEKSLVSVGVEKADIERELKRTQRQNQDLFIFKQKYEDAKVKLQEKSEKSAASEKKLADLQKVSIRTWEQ